MAVACVAAKLRVGVCQWQSLIFFISAQRASGFCQLTLKSDVTAMTTALGIALSRCGSCVRRAPGPLSGLLGREIQTGSWGRAHFAPSQNCSPVPGVSEPCTDSSPTTEGRGPRCVGARPRPSRSGDAAGRRPPVHTPPPEPGHRPGLLGGHRDHPSVADNRV